MIYDWAFARRIRCSEQDRRNCMHLVSEILKLAKKARLLGLLSLIESIEACPHPFLKKGLQFIVDGERPPAVREILEITILAGGFRGRELLERCIILEGLMAIQAGLNPHSIKQLLLSFLGEELALAYEAEFGNGNGEKWDGMLNAKRPARSSNPLPSSLNLLFNGLSDDAIQDFLKEINTHDLAKVFKQMNAKTQKRVFKTLPQRAAAFLRETLEQLGQVPPSELTEAQERVEAVLKELLQRPAPPELAG
jgi:hypothetical protein